jgi:RNA polymerase sigma factor (sigma-70 family)
MPENHSARPAGPQDDEPLYTATIDLLHRARAGDERSFAQLYERYFPRLARWATGRLPATARGVLDTQDIVQEVLVRSLQRLDGFDPQRGRALQAYLKTGVLNAIRDRIRRARPAAQIDARAESIAHEGASPLEQVIGAENLARYEAALLRLPARDREAIVARIEMQCSYGELAEALGCPTPDAARMAVKRALLRLAEEMDHGNARPQT